jgi:hypothetical protein
LTGGFPFLLGGVRFQVLITTTLTITDVPKNMAVLRKRIDWAALLGEGLDTYWKRSLSGLHHRDGGGKIPGGEEEDSPFLKMISTIPSAFFVNSGSMDCIGTEL